MINISTTPQRIGELTTVLLIVLSSSFLLFLAPDAQAGNRPRYKKETSVDFEEAMVEGKSRKPYSAYLTQQKEEAFANLHSWSMDFAELNRQHKQKMEEGR